MWAKLITSLLLISLSSCISENERIPKSISSKNEAESPMKAVHGPTSSIIDFRRACVVTYQVDPDVKPETITNYEDTPVNNLNECAYLCYQSSCRNAIFEPGTGGEKGRCKTSLVGHEDCSGRLQRHYNFKTDKTIVLSCVRCVGERPVTLSPDALFPKPTHAPLVEELSPSTLAQKSEATTEQSLLTTAGEELPPESTTITGDLSANSTTNDTIVEGEKKEDLAVENKSEVSDEGLKLKDEAKLDGAVTEEKIEKALEVEKKEIEAPKDVEELKEKSGADLPLGTNLNETTEPPTDGPNLSEQSSTTNLDLQAQSEALNNTTSSDGSTEAPEVLSKEILNAQVQADLLNNTTSEGNTTDVPSETTTLAADASLETTTAVAPSESTTLAADLSSTTLGSNETAETTTLAAEEKKELPETPKQEDQPLAESKDGLPKKTLEVVPTAAGVKTSPGGQDDHKKIEEAHKNATINATTALASGRFLDGGCLITFQADPLEERPPEFRSSFELIIEAKGPEICATRCYQDGCTGALYFIHNSTCILGYGDRHYCAKRPLVKFVRFGGSDEIIWLHCVGCRSTKHGIQSEVLNFAEHSSKLKAARVSKLLSGPLFQAELPGDNLTNNGTAKIENSGGPFGKTSA